jgi:hypothetical protein
MLTRVLAALALALAFMVPQFVRTQAAAPTFSHIYEIMMENTNYDDVIGNTADAPYINYLAETYSFAANYYGVTHPSEPNYISSIAGDFFGLHADDPTKVFDQPNLVDQLESKGLTWATYQQQMPSVGFTGNQYPATGSGLYVKKHNPFQLFSDILNSPTRQQNIKPLDALATDLNSGHAPNYAFIVPDQCHDMHGVGNGAAYGDPQCSYPPNFTLNHHLIQQGDATIKSLVTSIMASPGWTADSVIAVTWDENESSGQSSPNRGYASSTGCCGSPVGDGGGRVPFIFVTNMPDHTVSLRPYNHYSLLKTIEDNWGLGCLVNTCTDAVHDMIDLIPPAGTPVPLANTLGIAITFYSKNPGQGYVLFGTGPGCSGLVETSLNDIGSGTTTHTVLVTGNELPGTVGNIGLTPGTTYWYEVVTLDKNGSSEVDNNSGACYAATVSKP